MENIQLPILIRRASRLIDQYIDVVLKSHKIARSQYRVLYYVNSIGKPTQKELLDKLNVKGSTLTIIVDSLVSKKYLIRECDKRDKRIKRLSMTEKGKNLFHSIPDPIESLNQKFCQSFNKEQMQELKNEIQKIIKILK